MLIYEDSHIFSTSLFIKEALQMELYPFHLVSDFRTDFILEPKMAFVNEIITIKKPFSVLK